MKPAFHPWLEAAPAAGNPAAACICGCTHHCSQHACRQSCAPPGTGTAARAQGPAAALPQCHEGVWSKGCKRPQLKLRERALIEGQNLKEGKKEKEKNKPSPTVLCRRGISSPISHVRHGVMESCRQWALKGSIRPGSERRAWRSPSPQGALCAPRGNRGHKLGKPRGAEQPASFPQVLCWTTARPKSICRIILIQAAVRVWSSAELVAEIKWLLLNLV